jgi:galactose oxidase
MQMFERLLVRLVACLVVLLGPLAADAATLPLKLLASNLCLAVAASSTADGAAIVQSACDASASEHWQFRVRGSSFQLVAQHSGKCLDIYADATTDGAQAVQNRCKGNDVGQLFAFRAIGSGYAMVASNSGKCLVAEGGSAQPGARIVQQPCADSARDLPQVFAQQVWVTNDSGMATAAWSALVPVAIIPVAAANLPDGKVLMWSAYDPLNFGANQAGQTYTTVFDPVTSSSTALLVTNTAHDMFCPGTANLPDGRVLVNGGSTSLKTSIYDWRSGTWSAAATMNIARGYEGSVTLSNGDVLTWGGSWNGPRGGKTGEVWNGTNGWRLAANLLDDYVYTADPAGPYRADNHLWLFAGSNGRVFHAGPSHAMHWVDTQGAGSVTAAGDREAGDAMNGTATMFDIGRILTLGGAPAYENSTATANATLVDLRNGVAVRALGSMAYTRALHNSVVLPNGQVVAVGGMAVSKVFNEDAARLTPEIWDPRLETFAMLPPIAVARVYHSVALLLPDGRVLSGGGGQCGSCAVNHRDVQLLTPPYLLNPDGTPAPRPSILTAPASAALGATVNVTTDSSVTSFALVRMSSVTHSVDIEQRRIPLGFTATGKRSYALHLPADPGVAVPGYYMLFALNENGVPSKAFAIRIG